MTASMPEIGSRFGNYEIERLIDHGGMGYVYLVRHPVLHVERALKVLDPRKVEESDEFVERFNREAQLACRVHHPNLVEVHDAGLDAKTGLRYIVMEYVPGGTLRGRLKSDGRIPWREALAIVRQTAEALAAVARRGSVHRDIKPENIMFAADGSVRLADFGIAKAAADDTVDTLETRTDQAFGTPAYMSPEQVKSAASVDVRADIWSLGVVLFEMLAGCRPYRAETSVAILTALVDDRPFPDIREVLSRAETLRTLPTVVTGAAAPSAREIAEVPDAVAELIAAMCDKDIRRRIASPEEVIRRIDAICGVPSESETAVLPPPAVPSPKPRSRQLPWLAAALVAMAVVFTLAAVFGRLFVRRRAAADVPRPAAVEVVRERAPEPEGVADGVRTTTREESSVVTVSAPEPPSVAPVAPLSPGCTVCIGASLTDAVYRPATGMTALGRSAAEAISARVGLVILSPAEECARARVSRNGYALKLSEVCDALRGAGIACRYRRSAGTSDAAMRLDAAASRVCSFRSIAFE